MDGTSAAPHPQCSFHFQVPQSLLEAYPLTEDEQFEHKPFSKVVILIHTIVPDLSLVYLWLS